MDFEGLVEPFASYIDYFIQFWFQCDDCLQKYQGLNLVSTDALLLALVAVLLHLLLRYTMLNIAPPDPRPDSGPGPAIDVNSAIFFLATSFATVIFFEIGLLLNHARTQGTFGSIYDSVNAGLLSSAALYPITAISTRIQYICQKMQKVGPPSSHVAVLINLVTSLFALYLTILSMKPFAVLHGVSPKSIVAPAALGLAAFMVPVLVGGAFLFEWNKYVSRNTPSVRE